MSKGVSDPLRATPEGKGRGAKTLFDVGRSEEGQATVYQKHRCLLTRKRMYRH